MNVAQLMPNEARFLDFAHPVEKTAGGRNEKTAGGRIELFGLVRFTPGHEIGSSLQIVDSQSGETAWAASVASLADPTLGGQGGNPTPAAFPIPGTVGFVRNQILQVSMVHYEHDPAGSVHPCARLSSALRRCPAGVGRARGRGPDVRRLAYGTQSHRRLCSARHLFRHDVRAEAPTQEHRKREVV